jgi:hypothetical protein
MKKFVKRYNMDDYLDLLHDNDTLVALASF